MDRSRKRFKIVYNCITTNTSAIWQHAAHSPANLLLLAAKQEPYRKAHLLTKNIEDFLGKKRASRQEKKPRKSDRTWQKNKGGDSKLETSKGGKGWGRHQTSPAFLWGTRERKKDNKDKIPGK